MGAVDLVCQVESPGSVARGLQRVGRAGHVVRGVSKGRLIAKTPGDLLESAALCRAMLDGRDRAACGCRRAASTSWRSRSSPAWRWSRGTSRRCSTWSARRIRSATSRPRRSRASCGWSRAGFPRPSSATCGRGSSGTGFTTGWRALPGTAQLALVGGGTIPDTGQFPVYLGEGGPRLGELDEEFVFERRVGETFVLGNATWRIEAIEPHRVVVSRGRGADGGHAVLARRERGALAPSWARRSACSAARSPSGSTIRTCSPGSKRECRLTPTRPRALREYRRPPEAAGGGRARRSDDPDRDVPRPGGRAGPGRAHAASAASCTMRSSSPSRA